MKHFHYRIHHLLILLLLSVFIFSDNLKAETRYVSDKLVISVRSGPGKSFKIIKTINTGTSMLVLEDQGDFIKVKTEGDLIGWVPKFYTDSETPKPVVIKQLRSELDRMEREAEELANQKDSLASNMQESNKIKSANQQTIDNLSQELLEIKKKYESIMEESNSIIKTTKERDQLKQETYKIKQKLQQLEDANNSLSDYKIIYWFLAGGGTFLLGWLIGKISRKNQKRTLSI